MYKYAIRWLCASALVVSAGTAHATFHLWQLNEIYSNADGTVQFIELIALAGGQQFLTGHTITSSQVEVVPGPYGEPSSQVATTNSFRFPSDLPGDTQGKTFLIGTTGFAALGLVSPDYIVPNGFLFTPDGSVNFAGVDSVSWTALPVDGVMSIDRFRAMAINSPTNFAGQTATISTGSGITPVAPSGTLPLYRFFNNIAGGHFYTIDEAEKTTVIQNYNWFRYEGIGFYASPVAQSGMLPVYRFFNNNAGGHFYTIDEAEKNTVIQNYNWFRYEGISFYASPFAQPGTLPLYRFFNNNAGGHFYTISEAERNGVIQNYDWFRYEGIGLYAYPPP